MMFVTSNNSLLFYLQSFFIVPIYHLFTASGIITQNIGTGISHCFGIMVDWLYVLIIGFCYYCRLAIIINGSQLTPQARRRQAHPNRPNHLHQEINQPGSVRSRAGPPPQAALTEVGVDPQVQVLVGFRSHIQRVSLSTGLHAWANYWELSQVQFRRIHFTH